jgi:hypothetical protein
MPAPSTPPAPKRRRKAFQKTPQETAQYEDDDVAGGGWQAMSEDWWIANHYSQQGKSWSHRLTLRFFRCTNVEANEMRKVAIPFLLANSNHVDADKQPIPIYE